MMSSVPSVSTFELFCVSICSSVAGYSLMCMRHFLALFFIPLYFIWFIVSVWVNQCDRQPLVDTGGRLQKVPFFLHHSKSGWLTNREKQIAQMLDSSPNLLARGNRATIMVELCFLMYHWCQIMCCFALLNKTKRVSVKKTKNVISFKKAFQA